MPHRLLSGKYNLPETKGINLRMLESTALSAISITEFLPDSNDGKECVDHRKTDLDVEAIILFFPTHHREADLWHFCLITYANRTMYPRSSLSQIVKCFCYQAT